MIENISSFSEELSATIGQLWRSGRTFLRSTADPFIKGVITFPQFLVLDYLAGGAHKMKDIAQAFEVTLPAATGIIDRLVSLHMVKRSYDPKDRRVIMASITPQGEKAVESVKQFRKKMIEKMFSGLNESERQAYLAIIKKIEKNLHEKVVS